MATRKSSEEQLQALERRLQQLQNQKKSLLAKESERKRKERTKRLIEIGAEVESALGFSLDTAEARKALGDFLRQQELRGKYVTRAIDAVVPKKAESATEAGTND